MKKILIAVDETKGSRTAVETFKRLYSSARPESVVLLTVQKMEGKSVMDDLLLSESEMNELKEALKGSEYQELLDKKAKKVLEHYVKELEDLGIPELITMVREGHPAEEIIQAATDEGVEMVIIGSRGKRPGNLFVGSVSREVVNNAGVPVLVAR
jgi:nucleotide-binding universal stress UspA family protein